MGLKTLTFVSDEGFEFREYPLSGLAKAIINIDYQPIIL